MAAVYHKKLSQGKTEKQALIYVGKKLLQIALSMLKSGEAYNPARVFAKIASAKCLTIDFFVQSISNHYLFFC
jgi:hypothetical protein